MTFLLSFLASFGFSVSSPFPDSGPGLELRDYWFDKAEVTRYSLRQQRYGEMREGQSLLIFVTEPFLTDRQVKHEFGPGENAVPVLKLNRIRTFPTGIYDYRMMASVFHPAEKFGREPAGLKTAMSSTEWCGLSFQQVNRRGNQLEVELRSYFQAEGDRNLSFDSVWTEDELWLRLRLDPSGLPTGAFRVLPELFYQRLAHLSPSIQDAVGSLDMEEQPAAYRIEYPGLDRVLTIQFEGDYPHRILGWKETVDGAVFSEATATHSEMLYYWELNSTEDRRLIEKLGGSAQSP